jgi:uncharacterized membrane protein YGL010W
LIASQDIAQVAGSTIVVPWSKTVSYQLRDIVLYLHILAWLAQFYGHGVHEGRAPALATNVSLTLLAPFFVTFEFLNEAFGYKEDEMKETRKRIEADIAMFKEQKNRKKTKHT